MTVKSARHYAHDPGPMKVDVETENSGQTPAFNFRLAGRIYFPKPTDKAPMPKSGQFGSGLTVIGPGGKYEYTGQRPITPKLLADLKAGKRLIFITILAEYKDSFGNHYRLFEGFHNRNALDDHTTAPAYGREWSWTPWSPKKKRPWYYRIW